MKFPLSWINEYLDIDLKINDVSNKLLQIGFEVESVTNCSANLEHIVIGCVIDVKKLTEKLNICTVQTNKLLNIVTNDKSVKKNEFVVVATENAVINDVKIIKREICGAISEGMFCSYEDLKIDLQYVKLFNNEAKENQVLRLNNCSPGQPLSDCLKLNDYILDISIPANRGDLCGITYLAKELSVIYNCKLIESKSDYNTNKLNKKLPSIVIDEKYCTRYMLAYVDNIVYNHTPLIMKTRLYKCGIIPKDDINDIANYVMIEYGVPLHIYDADKIKKEINLKLNNKCIKTQINGKNINLLGNNLTICDLDNIISVAGVAICDDYSIKHDTKNILIEAANYKKHFIRNTAITMGLKTEAVMRYEKGINFYNVECGMKGMLNLVSSLKLGKINSEIKDIKYNAPKKQIINMTYDNIYNALGIIIQKDFIKQTLMKLGFQLEEEGNNLTVISPKYRNDIETYQDLVEEIIRFYGFDKLIEELPSHNNISTKSNSISNIELLKKYLSYELNEVISYSFINSDNLFQKLEINDAKLIKIKNPISIEYNTMRNNLVLSMLNVISYNYSRKQNDLNFFEIAKTYENVNNNISEKNCLIIALAGDKYDYYNIKYFLNKLEQLFKIKFNIKQNNISFMHKNISCDICFENDTIGFMGKINAITCDKFNISNVFILHLCLDSLINKEIKYNKFKVFSNKPVINRDIAIIVDNNINAEDILKSINSTNIKEMKNAEIFDEYTGEQIEKGKKSIAINIKFESEYQLKDKDIDNFIEKIIGKLNNDVKASIRK